MSSFSGTANRKKELLFVNKKKQKDVICFCAGLLEHRAKRRKSFLVLFFKKELLASLNLACVAA
jgi:hypothetical protein